MSIKYNGPSCQGHCPNSPRCNCIWTTAALTNKSDALTRCLLASGSKYRAELLSRLKLPFLQISPDADESHRTDESPTELAHRLAKTKADAPIVADVVAKAAKPLIIIASDQVAALGDTILGKPGTLDRARQQLQSMQGHSVSFHTSLYMLNTADGSQCRYLDTTIATLRSLSASEIDRYLASDNPLDCAGSFKVETLGISLFSSVETTDPTALVGLPMISVCEGLRQFGLEVP